MFYGKRMRAKIKRRFFYKDNTLLAGPWIGEFGWELFCWQGYLRARSMEFEKVIISSRPAMEPLYADFCHKFIPYVPDGVGVSGYKNLVHTNWPEITNQKHFREYVSGEFYIGYNRDNPARSSKEFLNQKFIKYGKYTSDRSYDVVLHIRNTAKNNSDWRNGWKPGIWLDFLKRLNQTGSCNVCCIGDINDAGLIDGCIDMRGLPLNDLFDLLASSRVLVGPSSGPMHLGSLCGCPHVVWSGETPNQPKYEKYWNPFDTPVKYIHIPDWKPSVELVVKHTLEMMKA